MYILAHDLGTTGNRATLFDTESGRTAATAFDGYATAYPRPTWAEQDPDDWWRAVSATSRAVLASSGIAPGDVAVVSLTGMLNSILPVDRDGEPVRPAMIWTDQRAAEEAGRMARTPGIQAVYRRTGHRPGTTYAAARILWMQRHQPDLYVRVHQFLAAKDHIAHRLTGVFACDYSEASATNLFDLERREWAADIIDAVGLDRQMLPPAYPSTAVVGTVTPAAAEHTGLLAGTPVVIGGTSGACAAVGAGSVRPGDVYSYIGASSWVAVTSERPLLDPQMRTESFCHLDPRLYFAAGTMMNSGGAFDWLEQLLHSDADRLGTLYDRLAEAAAGVEPGAGGLLFLPYLAGERSPHWNPQARGAFVGLTAVHGQPELTRAVLEGVAFNLKLILDAFLDLGAAVGSVWVIGRGARYALWRQILADVFGLPVMRPLLASEAKATGAAVVGGVGVGLFPDLSVVDRFFHAQDPERPDPARQRRYAALYTIFRQTYAALDPVFKQLSGAGR